mmetsp:Transcript_64807/g.121500  ORF Transcript_64807/g.121500 Transcript_64807/m.121500 type:complete len:269 (+) Transcript_64807:15-821(+)
MTTIVDCTIGDDDSTVVCSRCTLENEATSRNCAACDESLKGFNESGRDDDSGNGTSGRMSNIGNGSSRVISSRSRIISSSSSSSSSGSSKGGRQQSSMLNFFGAAAEMNPVGVKVGRVNVHEVIPGAWVLQHAIGREVKSWSKIYVPLLFSALGHVPEACARCVALGPRQTVSTPAQISAAQTWWRQRFSLWDDWVKAVRGVVETETEDRFMEELVLRPRPKGKTTLVFGDGARFGWLPHPHARNQEMVVARAGIDGEISTCISFSIV